MKSAYSCWGIWEILVLSSYTMNLLAKHELWKVLFCDKILSFNPSAKLRCGFLVCFGLMNIGAQSFVCYKKRKKSGKKSPLCSFVSMHLGGKKKKPLASDIHSTFSRPANCPAGAGTCSKLTSENSCWSLYLLVPHLIPLLNFSLEAVEMCSCGCLGWEGCGPAALTHTGRGRRRVHRCMHACVHISTLPAVQQCTSWWPPCTICSSVNQLFMVLYF